MRSNRARALFATHFHELTHLGQRLPRLVNLCMRVTDWNGDVVFLHEVARGAADRSYGVQVARLAGLPTTVVERARHILAELEQTDRRAPVERLVADLPLFALPELPAPAPPQVRRTAYGAQRAQSRRDDAPGGAGCALCSQEGRQRLEAGVESKINSDFQG